MPTKCLWAAAVLAIAACAQSPAPLPGTGPLSWEEDLSGRMMDGAHRFVERKIAESLAARQRHWQRDLSSPAAYEKSVEPNRQRFLEKIGVVDPRLPAAMERFGDDRNPALVAADRVRIASTRCAGRCSKACTARACCSNRSRPARRAGGRPAGRRPDARTDRRPRPWPPARRRSSPGAWPRAAAAWWCPSSSTAPPAGPGHPESA